MRWHELYMQASPIRFARLPYRGGREFRLELQVRAVSDLEAGSRPFLLLVVLRVA